MTKNMNSENYCHCNINDDRKDFDNGNNKIHNSNDNNLHLIHNCAPCNPHPGLAVA